MHNMSICYFKLRMYEDTIESCQTILNIHKDNIKSLELKAKSLAFLGKFRMSIDIFESIGYDLKWVKEL